MMRIISFLGFLMMTDIVLSVTASPPNTNVKAIHSAQSVVVGVVINSGSRYFHSYELEGVNGEKIVREIELSRIEFQVESVLENGSGINSGDTLVLNLTLGSINSLNLPENGEKILLGIDQLEGASLIDGYSVKNSEAIRVSKFEDQEALKNWVNKVRSSNMPTLNAMINEEYKTKGISWGAANLKNEYSTSSDEQEELDNLYIFDEPITNQIDMKRSESELDQIEILNSLERTENINPHREKDESTVSFTEKLTFPKEMLTKKSMPENKGYPIKTIIALSILMCCLILLLILSRKKIAFQFKSS